GKDHAKWQAVIAPGYKMETTIEFDKKRLNDVKEFLSKIPEDIAEIKGDKLVLKDEKKLAKLQYYLEKENIDFITIKMDPTKITFTFETDGSLTTKDAMIESLKILEKKYSEFGKLLKEL
ncbi:MAG: hypothetical protein ACQXXF_03485, partial [Thermoplasmatota archaeon]